MAEIVWGPWGASTKTDQPANGGSGSLNYEALQTYGAYGDLSQSNSAEEAANDNSSQETHEEGEDQNG